MAARFARAALGLVALLPWTPRGESTCETVVGQMQSEGCLPEDFQKPSCADSCQDLYVNATQACANSPSDDKDDNGQVVMMGEVFKGLQSMCGTEVNESTCMTAYRAARNRCESNELALESMCNPNGTCFQAMQSLLSTECLGSDDTILDEGRSIKIVDQLETMIQMCAGADDPCKSLMMKIQSEGCLGKETACEGSCPAFYVIASQGCPNTTLEDEKGQPVLDGNEEMMLGKAGETMLTMCARNENESACMTAFKAGAGMCPPESMCDPSSMCIPAIQGMLSTVCLGSNDTFLDEDTNESVKIVDHLWHLGQACSFADDSNESTCMMAFNAGRDLCEGSHESMCDPNGMCFQTIQSMMSTVCLGTDDTFWDEDKKENIKIVDAVGQLTKMCAGADDPCMGLMMKIQSEGCLGQHTACEGSCPAFYVIASQGCPNTTVEDDWGRSVLDENGQEMMLGKAGETMLTMCAGNENESTCMTGYKAARRVCENIENGESMCDPNGMCFQTIQSLLSTVCLGSDETVWEDEEYTKIVDVAGQVDEMCNDPCMTLMIQMQSQRCLAQEDDQQPSCADSCQEFYVDATQACANTPSEGEGPQVMMGVAFASIQQMCQGGTGGTGGCAMPVMIPRAMADATGAKRCT